MTSRRYIDGSEVRITPNDGIFVDVEFYGGLKIEMLEPKRLFPISGLSKYITLLDSDGNEAAIIRSVDSLLPDSKKTILRCLEEYYMIPKISRLISRTEKFRIWLWTVETDRGIHTFEINNHITSIKTLYDGRILIKDASDNRYEIPDIYALDRRSQKLIMPDI